MKKIMMICVLCTNVCLGALELHAAGLELRPLSSEIVLNRAGIVSAAKSKTDHGFNLNIALSKTGAKSLRDYSIKHPGEHLVVLLQDKVLNAPIMKGPIEGNSFVMSGLTESEADQVLEALRK